MRPRPAWLPAQPGAVLERPCDYGFIEGSLVDDGDPLDVLVVISKATFPGCVVRVRPVEVENLFQTYGRLEDRQTDVREWLRTDEAWRIIEVVVAQGADAADGERGVQDGGTWR